MIGNRENITRKIPKIRISSWQFRIFDQNYDLLPEINILAKILISHKNLIFKENYNF